VRSLGRPRLSGWGIAAVLVTGAALLANWRIVGAKVRNATPRDGGKLIETEIVTANVKVEGAGPTIVMIHGFSAAIGWWDPISDDLATDHQVVRLDLIGHGGTAAPRAGYAIERQAALVSAVLDNLGVESARVIGHSMGGEVATALVEMRPTLVERLVLIDSPATVDAKFTPVMQAYLTPVLGEAISRFMTDNDIRRGLAQGFAPGFPIPERFVADFRQLTYKAFRLAHEESVAYRTKKPTYERLAAIVAPPPLLAITGSMDAIVSLASAMLYARVRGARVEIVPGSGHSPMIEKPKETLAFIREFLRAS
jgi:pimeloyl-ACP methyl ester carboxylesterase